MASVEMKIKLRSSDGMKFKVDEAVAKESKTILQLIEDGMADKAIPLPKISGKILRIVLKYCKKHVEYSSKSAVDRSVMEEFKRWESDFVQVDQITLFELIRAAWDLKIEGLLDLTCQTAADMIKRIPLEEIGRLFSVGSDLTPEEQEEIRRENQWAFEPQQ
ncbi:SKP1-like protein 4 [Apostasia shenzhenica]|uniref:SKP1-like protein n=1 Tax=Apostasia shenzhenica TaxID=1088818 RepID=A0A2H9ZXM4_9ASPA|nr:SKP1-like protein 4 [Apostasia shenzhenica]